METANGFILTARQNTIAAERNGTVIVSAGLVERSFRVALWGPAPRITLVPAEDWTNIPAAGAQGAVNVSTNAPSINVSRPAWLNIEQTAVGFRLTAPRNTGLARGEESRLVLVPHHKVSM